MNAHCIIFGHDWQRKRMTVHQKRWPMLVAPPGGYAYSLCRRCGAERRGWKNRWKP